MILSNQVHCNKCGDEPYSTHRHDFKYCKCGTVAVDGGMAYLKRVGDLSDYVDMSITMRDDVLQELKDVIKWAEETGRNDLGLICAVMRVLRDSGYDVRKTPGKEYCES